MAITQGDVRLVKSKIMLDTPEAGQGPTGNVIQDGVSNDIFPDVSSLDRVNGRVNARQIHLHINTVDVEMYLGANMVVSVPPDDENISITLVETGETFDTRADAMSRIEAYLFLGPSYPGYLFGNHIAGMQTITIFQRSDVVPTVGSSMVITKREGYGDEQRQYIRVVNVSVTNENYEDGNGVYARNVVVLSLSDPLRFDLLGFDMSRYDPDESGIRLRTRLSNTVVANAARYYSVVRLAEPAAITHTSAMLESIYTQIVPSAQVETPVADARANQVSAALIQAGSSVSLTISSVWAVNQALFIGGGIYPGSLTVVRSGVTVTDAGGKLMSASVQVGVIDYENGILTLSSNVFGTGGGSHTVTYTPAAIPETVNQSQGFKITIGNRSLNYIRTIEPPPVKGSLSVSYRAQGTWYTLRDNGAGELRGSDSAFGAGMVNDTTGTISTTLGALPDVDSMLIYQWVERASEVSNNEIKILNGGKLYWAINADGLATEDPALKGIKPNYLEITWNDGTARTVEDDGAGNLTGYATGTVDYARGIVRMSPTTLPPPGTTISINTNSYARIEQTVTLTTTGSDRNTYVSTFPVQHHSVYMRVQGQRKFSYSGGPLGDFGTPLEYVIIDVPLSGDDGKLVLLAGDAFIDVGGINYADGTLWFDASVSLSAPQAAVEAAYDNMYVLEAIGASAPIRPPA